MQITQRLAELEATREWSAFADALEQAIELEPSEPAKAELFLRLGRTLNEKLARGPRALKAFQQAWKLQPADVGALHEASRAYWDLAKIKMVETVLRKGLAVVTGEARAKVLVDLADVLQDLGDYDAARECCHEAAAVDSPLAFEAQLCGEDLSVDAASQADRIDELVSDAAERSDVAERARLLIRAARIARRFAAPRHEELLLLAYQADRGDRQTAALYEELLASDGRLDEVMSRQVELLDAAGGLERSRLALRFGARWATRHQDLARAAELFERAVRADPSNDAAFASLVELWGAQEGSAGKLLALAEELVESAGAPDFVLAAAGKASWRMLGDIERAGSWFARLAPVAPNHPELRAYEAWLGALEHEAVGAREPATEAGSCGDVARSAPPAAGALASPTEEGDVRGVPEDGQAAFNTTDVDRGLHVSAEQGRDDEEKMVVDEGDSAVNSVGDEDLDNTTELDSLVDSVSGADIEAVVDSVSGADVETVADSVSGADIESVPSSREAAQDVARAVADSADAALAAPADASHEASADGNSPASPAEPEPCSATPVSATPVSATAATTATASATPEPAARVRRVVTPDVQDDAAIAALVADAAKHQAARRNHDYVKTLVRIAEAYVDTDQRVSYYAQAADTYQKFSNAAEAAKCFECVLELAPTHELASSFLREFYEKRRDWEKLVELKRTQADVVSDVSARAQAYVDIAQLASERIKKPQLCIELWNAVRALDPSNVLALEALATFLERNRDWAELADVLSQLADCAQDDKERLNIVLKLAQTRGDRLNDDAGAADAWARVLELSPGDRRAQDNLKKKYLAIGRWDELEVLYAEGDKWEELIRVLEGQEAKEQDAAAKIGLLLKVAELWLTRRDKADRAARAYEKVLALDETHVGAAEALIPLYDAANNPKGLAQAIEVKLAATTDSAERFELATKVGELYEAKLKRPDLGLERYLCAFNERPRDLDAADRVERVARATNGWDALATAYREALGSISEQEVEVLVRLRLGRVLLDELARVDDALDQYRAVHEIEPQNEPALAALERLYRETKRFDDLLDVYRRQQELATTVTDACRILAGIASIQEGEQKNAAAAVATYLEVVALAPHDATALAALDRLYLASGDWPAYAELLRRRAELDVDEGQLVDLKHRLGKTLVDHLSDVSGGLECFREILFIEAENDAARTALEELLRHPELADVAAPARSEVARLLADVYESRESWAELVAMLEILAAAEEGDDARVALLRRSGRVLHERLGEPDRACDAAVRALGLAPANAELRAELESYAEVAGRYAVVADAYAQIAENASDASLAREYWLRHAAHKERLELVDDAAKSYERVLEMDPADRAALDALEDLFTRTERHEDLIAVVRRRLDLAADATQRTRLLSQIAGISDEKLRRPEEAIAAFGEILALDAGNLGALRALDALYVRQGLDSELSDVLERQIRLAADEDAEHRLMFRLAALQETKLGLVPAAIETYRQILERQADHDGALGALERLLVVPEFELEIAELLGPLYRASGDHKKLVLVYEILVRRADDVGRAVELLHEMADLHEDAGADPAAAFDTLTRALALDAASSDTLHGLERLAAATERFGDLSSVLRDLAGKQADLELGIALYTKAAGLEEHQLANVENAVALYRRILELDAQSSFAIDALETIFRAAARYAELSALLQQRASIATDPDEQKRALFQAAQVEEEVLGRVEQAVLAYSKALEVDSEDLRAIDALIRLYVGLSRWAELLAIYNGKVELVSDPEAKKRIFYQMGAVYERELDDVARAIDTYQRVLELDPDDLESLGRLDVLYQRAENWPELLGVLQREAELAADPAEAQSYQYRVAELYDRKLDDAQRAIDLYREILVVAPDHRTTLAALEALTRGTREPVLAAQVLEPIYQALGEWQPLVHVLEVEVVAATDAFHRVELLGRIAGLQEEMLNDPNAAFDTYSRAVTIDVTNDDSLAQFERLASMTGRFGEVASAYDGALDALLESEPARGMDVALRVANIYEEQLENLDSAIARYRRVLDVDPEHQQALASLDRLYQATERYDELAGVLARQAELGHEDGLAFKFRLAETQQHRLGDVQASVATYGEVIAEEPAHEGALSALESMCQAGIEQLAIAAILEGHYERQGQFDHLAGAYEVVLASTQAPAARLEQFFRLAELHEQRLVSPAGALGVHIRALLEHPTDERVLGECERLAGYVDDGWDHVANAYADALQQHSAPEAQCIIGKRLARAFEDELRDVQKAEETYRYVLTVVPGEVECLEQLDRIYTAFDQPAQLAEILEQRALLPLENYLLLDIYGRLGELYELRLAPEDPAKITDTVRVYQKIAGELDPTNEHAAVVLERLYTQLERWHDLIAVYKRQLEHAAGEYEQGEIWAKLGRVLGGYIGETRGAIDAWRRVLELKGDDGEALGALSELYEQTEQWGELTLVLERHMATVVDEQEHVAVLLRRARLHQTQLGRDDLALEDYDRALAIDFANLDALYAVADIWRARGSSAELLTALHQTADRAAHVLPAEHLLALYREMATLHQAEPAQAYEAIEAWRKLLEVDPRAFDAMAELDTLLRNDARWEEVVAVKMLRARAFGDPAEQAREYLEVAHIWEHQIGTDDGATPALEAVLALYPEHPDAYASLEKLHRGAARWDQLVELYMNRFDLREDAAERSMLLRRVARVEEVELGQVDDAYVALEKAFELDPRDRDTLAELERVTAKTKRWAQLIQTVNGWLEATGEPALQVLLCLRLAKWYGEDLDRPDYAQPYFARVAQLDPENIQARRQMASFLKKQGDWRQAGQLLEQALVSATDNGDRGAILADLGELLERHAKDADRGLAYYQRAADADPTYLVPLAALERMYEARGMMSELCDVLERKARAVREPSHAAEARLRAAGIIEKNLGALDRAATTYRQVLELDAGNVQAIRGLERVHMATSSWPELLEVLEMHLDVAVTDRERAELLMQIAELQETQFLKADLAAARLEQVVELDTTNLAAYEALARCYQKLRQWLELVQCLERHVHATDRGDVKIQLLLQIAQTFASQLQDQERALDAYLRIVDVDPHYVAAHEALAKLYERMDDPASAIDYMTRVAELTVDGAQRVEAFYRIGKQLEEKLGDRGQARERFEQALDLNSYHTPTLAALRAIAMDEADFSTAARLLDVEQQHTEVARVRARLLIELGKLRIEKLEEPGIGIEAFQLAAQTDPDNEDSALPLAQYYVDSGRFADAEPLTALLERKAGNKDRDVQLDVYLLHGRVSMELSKPQEALRSFQSAHRVALTSREAIRGLADANFALADWAGALTNYQKLLTALGDEESELRADVYCRLGLVKKEQGQVRQAISNFEKGLQAEPSHRPTLDAMVAVNESLNDWPQACAYRQQILDNVIDGDERYKLLLELAGIWTDKVGDALQGVRALEQAHELKPEDHTLLHRMLQLFQKSNQWDRVVSTLQKIADGDPKPERRARYLFTMGQVYRDKLDDPYQAAALFDESLDLNPEFIDAFARVDKILTQLGDWAKLERAYRKMIHRIVGKGNTELEYQLWHSLALVYRDRLDDVKKASDAFACALAVKPDAVDDRVMLAELATHAQDTDRALEQYRALLERDPMSADAYRAIYTLCLHRQAYDEAWCVANVLSFIGRANEEETAFYEDWRPKDLPAVGGKLDASDWLRLRHHETDEHIGQIFAAVALPALRAKIAVLSAKGQLPALPEQLKQDPRTSTVSFAQIFWWAAERLAVSAPTLYVRSDQPGMLIAAPCEPPATMAGQGVMQGMTALERAFVSGKHLAMHRDEHYMKCLFPTVTELTVMLFGAVSLVAQIPSTMENAAQIQATSLALGPHLDALRREQLKVAVTAFMKAGARANIKRWAQSVETTAARAGLLLAGDLAIAKKVIVNEPQLPNDLTPGERLKELLLFAVSDDYFALRKALGVAINPNAG